MNDKDLTDAVLVHATLMVTDLETEMTFILETWHRGSKVLHASVMSAAGRDADKRIRLGRVPLYIRRAARAAMEAI